MRKLHVILLTVFILLLSMYSYAQTWSAGDPISYVGITGSNTMYIPVGCQGTVAILTHDKDYYGTTPYNMRLTGTLTTVSGYTASHSMNGNGDCTIAFTKTSNTPLYDDLTQVGYSISDNVTDDGYDRGYDDPDINGTTNLSGRSWFGPTGDIVGSKEICPNINTSITYCVPVGPTESNANTGAYYYWYITSGAQPADDAVGVQGTYASGYSKFTFPTKPKGKYTLWVRAEKDGVKSPWDLGKSISVVVDYPQDLPQCNGSSSCSSGCGSSSGIDLKTGYVSPVGVYELFMSPHLHYITGNSETSDLKKCAGTQKIEYIQYPGCNGTPTMHVHVWTACGNVYCINESQWNNNTFTLPNGDIITRSNESGDVWKFIWNTLGGDTVTHVVTKGVNGSHEISGVTHFDGSNTARSITGNVTSYQDNPSGGSSPVENKYTVVSGQITQYQKVVNGSVASQTVLTYDEDGDKVIHAVNSAPNELNKEISMTYDANGNLASVTQNGKITRYTRTVDAQNRPKTTVTIEDEYGTLYGQTEYLFDTYTTTVTVKDVISHLDDQVTVYYYVVDGGGNKRYPYEVDDTLGNKTITKVYAPEDYTTCNGAITTTTNTDYVRYSPNSNLWGKPISTTVIPNTGQTSDARVVSSYSYVDDDSGRVASITYPTVNKGVYGSPVTETAMTPQQTFSYAGYRLSGKTDIDGSSTSYEYDSNGRPTKDETTRGGITVTTTYQYSTLGPVSLKQVATSNPSSTWQNVYSYYTTGTQKGLLYNEKFQDNSNNVLWEKTYNYLQNNLVQLGATSTTTVYYDENHNVFKTVYESSSYDSYGNLVSTTDANNKTVSYSKTTSSNQKIERTIYASGVYTENVSDCCKTLYSTDIDGKTTYYVYDNIGRLIKTYTNDSGQSETTPLVANAYDGFGRTASVTTRSNANTSRVTSYTYDSLNRVTKIDNPGSLYDEDTYYDIYGNVLARCKGAGQTTMYRYDALGRIIDEYYYWIKPSQLVLPTTTADKHNIYVEATNTLMAENAYRYTTNGLGQLTSVYWCLTGKTTSYTYDTLGRKASYTHDGNKTAYIYDPMGYLKNVTLNDSIVATYTYDDAGNRTRVDFGNGTWQTFSYGNDARYLSTGIDYAYKCDNNDTVTNKGGIRLTRSNGGNPLSWADNTDKFIKTFNYDTRGRLANADIPGVSRTDYGYDWVGNRTSPTAVYNDADQLTSYNGNTYTYYGEGGMINGAGRTFGYLPTGDPYQVSLNGTSKNGRFESHGLREVTYGATTTKYSYDITASTPAMITEGPNDGTTTYYYVREPDGELIMRKSGTDYKYYHFDEMGSTLFLTDASGIQTDKYVYNAWGKVVSSSGSTVNPYRYVGRYGYYYDTETNLYLLGKRYYDADAGVFCQRDAAKDGLSYYAYTSGKVMTATDPWGLYGMSEIVEGLDKNKSMYNCPDQFTYYLHKSMQIIGTNEQLTRYGDCFIRRSENQNSPCYGMRNRALANISKGCLATTGLYYTERCTCENAVVCMKRHINLQNPINKQIYNEFKKRCDEIIKYIREDPAHVRR